MVNLRLIAAVLLLTATTAVSIPAWPQPSRDRGALNKVLNRAEKDAGAGRYEEAVEGYRQAYAMSRDPLHHYNVSVIYLKALRDPLKAWEYAARFHEEAGTRSDAADARRWIQEVESHLVRGYGRIEIEVDPAEASVWLNGTGDERKLSRTAEWLVPGEHRLVVKAEGFEPREEMVDIQPGTRRSVRIELERSPEEAPMVVTEPATPTPVPAAEPPMEERTDNPYEPWAWSAMMGGSSFLVTGTVLYILARRELDFDSGKVSTGEYDRRVDRGKAMGYSSYAFWGFGAAALTAGLVLYFTDPDNANATIHPTGADGPGVAATFRF